MKSHIASVSISCYYHLRRLRRIRSCLDEESAKTVTVVLILFRLDYCNVILAGLPETTLLPFTRVLHTAARVVLHLRRTDHITQALRSLHWLPIRERIRFKLSLMMHNIVNGHSPSYNEVPGHSVFYVARRLAASICIKPFIRREANKIEV